MTSPFTFLAFLLLTLPWLNPFAPGPSPAIGPWLFSMAMLVAVLLLWAWRSRLALDESAGLGSQANQQLHRQQREQAFDNVSRAFGWSLLVAGLVSSVLALLQYFDVEALFAPLINPTEAGYAFANLRQRNQFASLTNLALAVLLVWAMRREAGAPNRGVKTVALAGAALLAIGNAASASRTGVVQVILLCVLFLLWGGWRHRLVQLMLATAAFAYAAAAVALPYAAGFDWAAHGLFARLQAGDAPCASRITLWSNVLHLVTQKPWLGWGWGELDYAHFITRYDTSNGGVRFCDILDNAHNLPLHLAVELGLPAAVLICAGFAWWAIRQKPWAEQNAARQMAWAVLAVVLLHSLLEYPLWYGPFQIAFGWSTYVLWRTNPTGAPRSIYSKKSAVAHVIRAQKAPVLIAVLIAILLCLTYAAWDYRRVSQIYLAPADRSSAYREDTVSKMRDSWLFADQARFAELLMTPVTAGTAAWVFDAAERTLRYSPEPRVAEKAIESAVMLGRDEEAIVYLAAYRAAFPVEHARWASGGLKSTTGPN